MEAVLCASFGQGTPGPDPHAVMDLITLSMDDQYEHEGELCADQFHPRSLSDTIVLIHSGGGNCDLPACETWRWNFARRRKLTINRVRTCTEPPLGIATAYSSSLTFRVVRINFRTYLTINWKKLPIASFEVVSIQPGAPIVANGLPHKIVLRPVQP